MKNENEYLMLKDEITWRLKAIDTLATFAYTIYISILGAALSTNIIELFLLPFVVIVPISLKVANHKYSVGYLAAYMNVFLENLNEEECFKWEKMHNIYYKLNPRALKENVIYYGASIEYIIMCLLSSVIFWIKYVFQDKIRFTLLQIHGYIFIQLFAIFLVTYITFSYVSFQKIKPSIIDNWEKVKDTLQNK